MNSTNLDNLPLHTDGHVHTKYCHHAIGEMEEYVISALQFGLKEIVFLEHMEAGIRYFESTWLTENDFDTYFSEGKFLQKKYSKKIKISLGVEVGYNPACRKELLERLAKRKWDRIGVSYHFMPCSDNTNYHVNLVSRKKENIHRIAALGCEQTISNYFSTLTEAVIFLPGTILCHLDAALRFQPGFKINTAHLKHIKTLLQAVKRKRMALEINTSGFPIRGNPFPMPFIIREALALGIPLHPGSDAHRPEDVGRNFNMLPDYITDVQHPATTNTHP